MYQKIIMSATNINMTTPKSSMHYDCTYPFAGLKKPTTVDAEAIRNKQYNYSGAIVSHGEKVEETVNQDTADTLKIYKYSGAVISHGERIEDIPEYVPKKKYMWTTVVDFFKQRQKFGRHQFVITPNI
jgi:hypothetical protein